MAKKITQKNPALFFVFIILIFIFGAYTLYIHELQEKPIIKQKIKAGEAEYLYEFYFANKPNTEQAPVIGNKAAPITIVAFLDFTSNTSKKFAAETLPAIKKEYIDTGKARFYHKNRLLVEDVNKKTDNFILALSFFCASSLKEEDRYNLYTRLFFIKSLPEIKYIFLEYNISKTRLSECIETQQTDILIEDISETAHFGAAGTNPKIYIGMEGNDDTILEGVPSLEQLRRSIKKYEIIVGY